MLTKVVLYTDGACSGNPGPGGWGCILSAAGKAKEMSGGEELTTNNRMELMAVIKGLEALNRPCEVDVYSDSAYVINAFKQDWISGWIKNGWKNSAKAPVANVDLWMKLIDLTKTHKVNFHKVKGHADDPMNNRCDRLAVEASSKFGKKGQN